jgi:hypothetical protein
MHQTQSSRRLEREAQRNVESNRGVMRKEFE